MPIEIHLQVSVFFLQNANSQTLKAIYNFELILSRIILFDLGWSISMKTLLKHTFLKRVNLFRQFFYLNLYSLASLKKMYP